MPALLTDTHGALPAVTDGTLSGHTHSEPSNTRLHAGHSQSLFVLVQAPTHQSQPHPVQVCELCSDLHSVCTVYVCNKWLREL